jgi:hypothetical protein
VAAFAPLETARLIPITDSLRGLGDERRARVFPSAVNVNDFERFHAIAMRPDWQRTIRPRRMSIIFVFSRTGGQLMHTFTRIPTATPSREQVISVPALLMFNVVSRSWTLLMWSSAGSSIGNLFDMRRSLESTMAILGCMH